MWDLVRMLRRLTRFLAEVEGSMSDYNFLQVIPAGEMKLAVGDNLSFYLAFMKTKSF
jgi:hypothetical protein